MTIPEAVSLVLLAGTYAQEGRNLCSWIWVNLVKRIFAIEAGDLLDSVKIDTLARNLIRLSGFTPDVDIKLICTGLLAGEKLYEKN